MFNPDYDPLAKLEEVEKTSLKSLDLSTFLNQRVNHQIEILQLLNNQHEMLFTTLQKQDQRIRQLEEYITERRGLR